MAAAAQRHSGRAEPRTGGGGRPRSAPGRAARPLRAKAAASLRASLRMRRLRRAAPAPPPTRPASAARGSGGDGCHGSSQRPPRCHARNAAQSRALARPECAPIGGRNAGGVGGAGETAFLRFLQRVARADAAHSRHDQSARAQRAAGRAAGGSSLAGGAALRGVCSPCLLAAVRPLMSSVTPSQLYTVAPCRGRARFWQHELPAAPLCCYCAARPLAKQSSPSFPQLCTAVLDCWDHPNVLIQLDQER